MATGAFPPLLSHYERAAKEPLPPPPPQSRLSEDSLQHMALLLKDGTPPTSILPSLSSSSSFSSYSTTVATSSPSSAFSASSFLTQSPERLSDHPRDIPHLEEDNRPAVRYPLSHHRDSPSHPDSTTSPVPPCLGMAVNQPSSSSPMPLSLLHSPSSPRAVSPPRGGLHPPLLSHHSLLPPSAHPLCRILQLIYGFLLMCVQRNVFLLLLLLPPEIFVLLFIFV